MDETEGESVLFCYSRTFHLFVTRTNKYVGAGWRILDTCLFGEGLRFVFLPRGSGFWFLVSGPWLLSLRPEVARPPTVLHLAAFSVLRPVAFAVRGG